MCTCESPEGNYRKFLMKLSQDVMDQLWFKLVEISTYVIGALSLLGMAV